MPETAIKSSASSSTLQPSALEKPLTLGKPNTWLAALIQEKKEQVAAEQPQKSLADLAKEKAEAEKRQAAAPQVQPQKEYKASEARTAVAAASQQAADTLNAIEKIGQAERDSRDIIKRVTGALSDIFKAGKVAEGIMGGNFKPDSMLAKVLGEVNDPKTLIEMYRAALPGGRKFNADHVKIVLAETNRMLQSASDLIKNLPADQASPATNTVGALAQRFLNVTDKLAQALRDKKPFENKDFAEMLRITAELRENGMAPKDSLINPDKLKEMKGLVNGKGEPSKEIKDLLASGTISIETRDKINALVDQVKSLDPKTKGEERNTALLKLYAEVLANTPEKS